MPDAAVWTHKDVVISLSGAEFTFRLDGKFQHKSSLAAAKKMIDKYFYEKAKEVVLDMPMVFWQENTWGSSTCVEGIGRATLTGLDQELKQKGLPTNLHLSYIMPDSPENEQLILDIEETKAKLEKLREEIEKRDISFYFGSSRNKKHYTEAVKSLQQRWAEARKASGLE